jgi:hypothetical protein
MTPKIKQIETITFEVEVRRADIQNGECATPSKCMHKIAIERALRDLDPKGGDHRTRVDGAVVRFNYKGHKWKAMTPKKAKVSLIQFDKETKKREEAGKKGLEFHSKVEPHKYVIEAIKDGKIVPMPPGRQEQINLARRKRILAGKPDKKKYTIRDRVIGLGSV